MKQFVIYTIVLLLICFISFSITYGYEEGTMRNVFIGKVFSLLFKIFKFPSGYILPSKYFIFSLIVDVLLFATVIKLIVNYLKKMNEEK